MLMNHCIFFMIVLLNIGSRKSLIMKIFADESEIIEILLEILKKTRFSKSTRIKKILCHIFFDEYYNIFFNNELEELYIINNSKFTEENTEGLDRYSKTYYVNILNTLVDLNITYEILSHNKVFPEGDEKSLSKLLPFILYYIFYRHKYILRNI